MTESKRKLLPFKKKNQWGLMDTGGTEVLQPQFAWVSESDNGIVEINVQGAIGFMDTDTLKPQVFPEWRSSGVMRRGLVAVRSIEHVLSGDGPEGYMNTEGHIVIEPLFASAGQFGLHGANATTWENPRKWRRISRQGEIMGEAFEHILLFRDEGLACGASLGDNQMVLIDWKGNRIGSRKYCYVYCECEGKIPVIFEWGGKEVGWLDLAGDVVRSLPGTAIGAWFQNGLVPVENLDGNWGIINEEREWVLDPHFDYIDPVGEGCFAVAKRDESGGYRVRLADSCGHWVTGEEFSIIHHFREGYAEVGMVSPYDGDPGNGKSNFIDRNGLHVSKVWSDPAVIIEGVNEKF